MPRITDMRGDFQPESSGSLFVTTCRGRGHIVAAPLQAAQLVSNRNANINININC